MELLEAIANLKDQRAMQANVSRMATALLRPGTDTSALESIVQPNVEALDFAIALMEGVAGAFDPQ